MEGRGTGACAVRSCEVGVMERGDDCHPVECRAPAGIMSPPEVDPPMIDHTRSEFPLFRNRMHDEHTAYVVSARRPRDIVDVQAGNGGRHALGVAIDDRMMNQRYE